jgi:hypothetical protein
MCNDLRCTAAAWSGCSRRAVIGLVVAAVAAFAATRAGAQSEEPLPVSATASPQVAWIHNRVTISGDTVAVGARSAVRVYISPPAGAGKPTPAPTMIAAELDSSGHYSAVFSATSSAGTYGVRVTAPDGEGEARISFRVMDLAAANSDAEVLTKIGPAVSGIVQVLRAKMDSLPASPAKDEMVRDFGELDRRMVSFVRDAPGAAGDIKRILEVGTQFQLTPQLEGKRQGLLSALGKAAEWVNRTPAEEERLRQQRLTCDNLEVVIEGFKFVSLLLNFAAGGPSDIAENFAQDLAGYAGGKAADEAGASDSTSFGTSTATKNVPSLLVELGKHGKLGLFLSVENDLAGNVSDLSAFAASKVMSAYCEQFTGPMQAHMKAQFFKDDRKWWEYEFDLRGKLTVHYPKDAAGSSVPVKGRLEGYAYNFKVWENALVVLNPGLMSSAYIKKIVIPPPDLGESAATVGTEYIEGSVAGAAGLNAFFFEVTGTVQKDKLILNIGAARSDTDAKARVIAIEASVLSMQVNAYSYLLPYKPAHFIFERASAQYTIPLRMHAVGETIRGKQHFENQMGGAEAKGSYSVDIEACNPDCGVPDE